MGTGSYAAAYNLGGWYEVNGTIGKARTCYEMAAKWGYGKAVERLKGIYYKMKLYKEVFMMEELMKRLEKIYEILEQISTITANQTTVILESNDYNEESEGILETLETMMSYKEKLIDSLVQEEEAFDTAYEPYRGMIKKKEDIQQFKQWVSRILTVKNIITETEQNNVVLLQKREKVRTDKMQIPKAAHTVVAAYQKYQVKP